MSGGYGPRRKLVLSALSVQVSRERTYLSTICRVEQIMYSAAVPIKNREERVCVGKSMDVCEGERYYDMY